MGRYVLRRLVGVVPLLVAITLVAFAVLHLAPGDPVVLLYGAELTPSELQQVKADWGLDEPLPVQYVKWLANLARGDLGRSYADGRPVLEVIAERVPATLTLTAAGLVVALAVGLVVGAATALRPNGRLDAAGTLLATFFYSVPNFWLALVLILIFSVQLGWLPSAGIESARAPGSPLDRLVHLILPAFVISLRDAARLMRYTRASLLDARQETYMRTALGKGLGAGQALWRHALPNALIPVITLLGLAVPHLISSSIVVETVFAWPGMGRLALEAALQRNYAVLMGDILLVGGLVVLGNLAADVGYGVVDPRVREGMSR